jgi:hypothetical protein
MGSGIDEVLKESKNLDLIAAYYSKHQKEERAKPHIKRILNEMNERSSWNDLAETLRKHKGHLSQEEKKQYIDRIVESDTSFTYDEAAMTVIEDFSDLVDDNKLASLIFDTLNNKFLCQNYISVDRVYEIIEKNKARLDRSFVSSNLPEVLGKLIAGKEMKKKDISKFEEYLGEKEKCALAVRILMNLYGDEKKFFDEYKEFIRQEHVYETLKEAISYNLSLKCGFDKMTNSIKLLRAYLQKEQVAGLLKMITNAKQTHNERTRDINDDIIGDGRIIGSDHEDNIDYGLLESFPDELDLEVGRKVFREMLAVQFFEEANAEDYESIEGVQTAEQLIKKHERFADKETVERALADALKKDIGLHLDESPVLKKFKEYVNKEYIGEAIAEYLSFAHSPSKVIKNFGDYINNDQLKKAVQNEVKRRSLLGCFRELHLIIDSAKERLDQTELSDFLTSLFEEVRINVKIHDHEKDDTGRTDLALDYLEKFAKYVKVNEKTDIYYELLEIRKGLKKEED